MDKATRSEARHPGQPPNQVEAPLTTPLERREIPAQLATTLEHIVGQLDVLTQVDHGLLFNVLQGCLDALDPCNRHAVVFGPLLDLCIQLSSIRRVSLV